MAPITVAQPTLSPNESHCSENVSVTRFPSGKTTTDVRSHSACDGSRLGPKWQRPLAIAEAHQSTSNSGRSRFDKCGRIPCSKRRSRFRGFPLASGPCGLLALCDGHYAESIEQAGAHPALSLRQWNDVRGMLRAFHRGPQAGRQCGAAHAGPVHGPCRARFSVPA